MNDVLCNAKRNLETAVAEINQKGPGMSSNELNNLHLALGCLCKISEIDAMDRNAYGDSSFGRMSYGSVHVPTIPGMPSFNNMSYGYPDGRNQNGNANYMNGHSGHSVKDRMIADLERMMDSTQSDYERQQILETIKSIEQREMGR